VLAEVDEVFRHVDQVGQAVDRIPEDGAHRSAPPQQRRGISIGSMPNRLARIRNSIDSQGSIIPKPSNGGIGIRFRMIAENCRKTRKASAAQKWEVADGRRAAKHEGRASRSAPANSRLPSGPAAEAKLRQRSVADGAAR